MILHTKFEEIIEIQQKDLLYFDQGIPGFEEEKEFVLLPMEGTPFSTLQSISTKDLAFFTTNPFFFFQNYDFELANTYQDQLKIKNESDVLVQVILTVNEPLEESTANLQAPIVINAKENLAKQIILVETNYRTRHALNESIFVGQEG